MFVFGEIKEKINKLEKSNLIREDDKILIAFSGGPDSVFLYRTLSFFKESFSLKLSILYVNHNLRYDVNSDLEFVKKFSSENNVDLYIKSIDVTKYALENKKSIELAARELRYKVLEETLNEIKYDKIATGHNLDDNVETFIFRLLRGTSIKGLKGIPKKRGNIIRPILSFEKKEILDCLKLNGEKYLTDYTNKENGYTRNYIRNEVFPKFYKINPEFQSKINELISEINKKEDEKESKNMIVKYLQENNIEINRRKIDQLYKNIFNTNGIINPKGSKEFNLGKNKFLRKEYGNIKIIDKYEKPENTAEYGNTKIIKINQSIEWYNYEVHLYNSLKEFTKKFSKTGNTDYVFLKFKNSGHENIEKLVIRSRKSGDMVLLNNLGHKKVKKILIDQKISKWKREEIPIIEYIQETESFEMKEIIAVGDIKFSQKVKKIREEEINKLEIQEKILIIGRKNGR
ncbi:tRNA lysidine(34) synthetase TilS [Leptotrichia sp. OH3620_COT-345]|uniref:tRNA lysidine(34) synthetase TilS n=1 Tax=Leptotrichia sp. OH3620_COT-345 TaxID=2491048 RepID=UPI000F647DED|nr:tRNA lysidine(34) synthetase TilS [Leptotrichia sp. OH3620_COT-345]RRD41097.1 tRNA lysidine(34) synthetase TilS [Leptotrichia sp. OH3620_COT-345]